MSGNDNDTKRPGWAIYKDPSSYLKSKIDNNHEYISNESAFEIHGIHIPQNKLEKGERGTILHMEGDFVGSDNSDLKIKIDGFDEEIIRHSMLIFDVLEFPDSSAISFNHAPEELTSFGICQKTKTEISGPSILRLVREPVIQAFETLNGRDEGRWSISRTRYGIGIPESMLTANKSVSISLYNSIPIPNREVPYEDVLNFKNRRSSELEALRTFIDELGIQASIGNDPLARALSLEKFDKALSDYNKVISEQNFPKSLRDLTVNFQAHDVIPALAVEFIHTLSTELTLTSAIVGAMWGCTSTIATTVTKGLFSNKMGGKPFEYIYHAHKEL